MAQYGKDIDKHIVTSGNLAMVAGGQDLFSYAGSERRRRKIHITRPGQLVAYTKSVGSIPQTVDVDTLTAEHAQKVFLAVGVDTNGDGVTDELRHVGREDISSCDLIEVSASSPKCGTPAVQDLYFTITGPGTYAVRVDVEDQTTRDFSPIYKGHEEFVASYTVTEEEFDDPDFSPNIVACALAKQLNNDWNLKIKGGRYPDWKGINLMRPFSATRLHDNSLTYCFAPTELSDSCKDCTHIDAVLKATVNGTDYTFTGNTDPADSSKTLRGQLENIAAQILDAFEAEYGELAFTGSAYVTGSYSECCPIQLHINTCDDAFALLTTGDAVITPTTDVNPFTEYGTFDNVQECIDCGDAPTQRSYTTGIRVIAERISGECGCYIDKPIAYYGRSVDIVPFSDDWKASNWDKVQIQEMEVPGQFGAQIQWLEYQQDVGGEGRNYNRSNVPRGWIGVPEKESRANRAVTASCETDYCSYFMRMHSPRRAVGDVGAARDLWINSNIHIPAKDATTKADWEAFMDKFISLNRGCETVGSVTCNTSQVAETLLIQ